MKKMLIKATQGILSIAILVSTVVVNSTCYYKLYQEELPEELNKLRKHV